MPTRVLGIRHLRPLMARHQRQALLSTRVAHPLELYTSFSQYLLTHTLPTLPRTHQDTHRLTLGLERLVVPLCKHIHPLVSHSTFVLYVKSSHKLGYQTVTSTYGTGGSSTTTPTASGTSSGTVVVYAAQPNDASTTYIATNSAAYTSTVAASGTAHGTVINGVPSGGYVTVTSTYGATSTTSTSVTASGSTTGTIVAFVPEPTDSTTVYVATNSPGYTSSYQAAGTTHGSYIVGSPSAGYTTTTSWTTSGAAPSTTTVVTAYQGTQGTVRGKFECAVRDYFEAC